MSAGGNPPAAVATATAGGGSDFTASTMEKRIAHIGTTLHELRRVSYGRADAAAAGVGGGGGTAASLQEQALRLDASSVDVGTLLRVLEEALMGIRGAQCHSRVGNMLFDSEIGLFAFIAEVLRRRMSALSSLRSDATSTAGADGGLRAAVDILCYYVTHTPRAALQAAHVYFVVTETCELLRRTQGVKGVSTFQEALFLPLQQALLLCGSLGIQTASLKLPALFDTLLKLAGKGVSASAGPQKLRKQALFFLGFVSKEFPAEVARVDGLSDRILGCYKANMDALMASSDPPFSVAAGILEGLTQYFHFYAVPADTQEGRAYLTTVYHIVCRGLELHDHTRYEVPKAALFLLENHAFLFKAFLCADGRMLKRVLTLVSHRNNDVTKQALAAAGSFVATVALALSEVGGGADAARHRKAAFADMFRTASELLTRTDSHSVSLGAVLLGHLMRPAAVSGSQTTMQFIVNSLVGRFFELYAEADVLETIKANYLKSDGGGGGDGDERPAFQDSIEVLARYLPAFVDSLAACVASMPHAAVTSTVEENLAAVLHVVFHHYGRRYVFASTRLKLSVSLLHLLLALYTKGEVLSRVLSNFVLNGLLQTLTANIVTVAGGGGGDGAGTVGLPPSTAPSLSQPPGVQGYSLASMTQGAGAGGSDSVTDFSNVRGNSFNAALEVRHNPYLTLWGVVLQSSTDPPKRLFDGAWSVILARVSPAQHSHFCSVVFDSVVNGLITVATSLDLASTDAGDDADEAAATAAAAAVTTAPASTPGGEQAQQAADAEGGGGGSSTGGLPESRVVPSNAADYALFESLKAFLCGVLAKVHDTGVVTAWLLPLANFLCTLRARHPQLPGVYELMAALAAKADWAAVGAAQADGRQAEHGELQALVLGFVSATMADVGEARGALLMAHLEVLLTLDPALIAVLLAQDGGDGDGDGDGDSPLSGGMTERLMDCVDLALQTGLSYAPSAELAVRALESWLRVDLSAAQHKVFCAKVVPILAGFVSSSATAVGDEAAGSTSAAAAATAAMKGTGIVSASRGSASKAYALRSKSERERLRDVQVRCIVVLGRLGAGAVADVLIGGSDEKKHGEAAERPWGAEKCLSVRLALADSKYTLSFDALLPRVCEIAKTHTERKAKVAACELLHSLIVWTVGRNAVQPSTSGGEQKKRAEDFTRLNSKLYPVVLKLATDAEPIAKQLFSKLLFQLVRWCTKNVHYESADTMVLLDAIVEGLSSSSDGHLRELCSAACAEFVKYSIKYGLKTADRNIVSVFTRLNALFTHPDAMRRLGAAKALRRIAAEVYPHTRYFAALVLPMLQAAVLSLAAGDGGDPAGSDGSASQANPQCTAACVALIKRCERMVVAKAAPLLSANRSPGDLAQLPATAASARGAECLEDCVSWLLEQCFFEEKLTRQWAMRLFLTFSTCTPGCDGERGPRTWIQKVYEKEHSLEATLRAVEARVTKLPGSAREAAELGASEHKEWSSELEAVADAYSWLFSHGLCEAAAFFSPPERATDAARPAKRKRAADGSAVAADAAAGAARSAIPQHVGVYLEACLVLLAAADAGGEAGAAAAKRLRAMHLCMESILQLALTLFAQEHGGGGWASGVPHTGAAVLSAPLLKVAGILLLRPALLRYDPHDVRTQTQVPALAKRVLKAVLARDGSEGLLRAAVVATVADVLDGRYGPDRQRPAGGGASWDLFRANALSRMLHAGGGGGGDGDAPASDAPAAGAGRATQAGMMHVVRGCRAAADLGVLCDAARTLQGDLQGGADSQVAAALCGELSHLPLALLVRPGVRFVLKELWLLCFDLGLPHDAVLSLLTDSTELSEGDLAAGRVSKSFSAFFLPSVASKSGDLSAAAAAAAAAAACPELTKAHVFYTTHRSDVCEYLLTRPPPRDFFVQLAARSPAMFYRVVGDVTALGALAHGNGSGPRARVCAAFVRGVGRATLVPLVVCGYFAAWPPQAGEGQALEAAQQTLLRDAAAAVGCGGGGGGLAGNGNAGAGPHMAGKQEQIARTTAILANLLKVGDCLLASDGGGGGGDAEGADTETDTDTEMEADDAPGTTLQLAACFALHVVRGGAAGAARLLRAEGGEALKNVCHVVRQLLPGLLRAAEAAADAGVEAAVLDALRGVVTDELPIHYTEVFAGEEAGGREAHVQQTAGAYVKVVDALMSCLSGSGSVPLLEVLLMLFRGSGSHPLGSKFVAHLTRYFSGMPCEKVLRAAARCVEVLADDDMPVDIRSAAVSRVLCLALLRLPAEEAARFFAEHCVQLYKLLAEEWPAPAALDDCFSAVVTKTSTLRLFELMYRLCPPEATREAINQRFAVLLGKTAGQSQYTGKEMNDKVMRTAYACVTDRLACEEAVTRAAQSQLRGRGVLLRFRQAAYNCLAAALLATQTNVAMITRLLFIPRKNEELFERIVDLEAAHRFTVETSFAIKEQGVYAIPHDWEVGVERASSFYGATSAVDAASGTGSATLGITAAGTLGGTLSSLAPPSARTRGAGGGGGSGGAGRVLEGSSLAAATASGGEALQLALTCSQLMGPPRARRRGGVKAGDGGDSDVEETLGGDSDAHAIVPSSVKHHKAVLLTQMKAAEPAAATPSASGAAASPPAKGTPPAATPQRGGGVPPGVADPRAVTWSLFSQNPAPPLTPVIDFRFKEALQQGTQQAPPAASGAAAAGFGFGFGVEGSEDAWERQAFLRYVGGDLEMDPLNRSSVMPTVLRSILFLEHQERQARERDGAASSSDAPAWMKELLAKAAAPQTATNVKLFIVRVVVNFADIFQPHAHLWAATLVDVALTHHEAAGAAAKAEAAAGGSAASSADLYGITYFVRDVVLTLISWGTAAANKQRLLSGDAQQDQRPSLKGTGIPRCGVEVEGRVATLVAFLLKSCSHKRSRVLQENLELVKLLVEQWSGRVRMGAEHKRILMGWVCYQESGGGGGSGSSAKEWVRARITGLQLFGVFIANDVPAYDPFTDAAVISEHDFHTRLLANIPPHPTNKTIPKELVDLAGEVIGMVLHQQSVAAGKTDILGLHRGTLTPPRHSQSGATAASGGGGGLSQAPHSLLHDRLARKLRSLHGAGQTEQFLLVLGGVVKHYPAAADEFLPHSLLQLVPLSKGPYKLLILEILKRRAEHFPTVYGEFHPLVHDLLVSTGPEAADIRLTTVEIVSLALLSGAAGAVASTNRDDVRHYVTHISRMIKTRLFVLGVMDVDSKAAVYDLWIKLYDTYADELSDDAEAVLIQYLLEGLHDPSTYIKDKILRFWDDPARLPATVTQRVERLLVYTKQGGNGGGGTTQPAQAVRAGDGGGERQPCLCSPALGDKWLQYSSILLLFLAHRSPDFRDRDTFFKDPLADCQYNEMKIYSSARARSSLRGFGGATIPTQTGFAGSAPATSASAMMSVAPTAGFGATPGFGDGHAAALGLPGLPPLWGRHGEEHVLATVGYAATPADVPQHGGAAGHAATASNFAHYRPRRATPSATLSQTAMLFQPFGVQAPDAGGVGGSAGAGAGAGRTQVFQLASRQREGVAAPSGTFFVRNTLLKKRFQKYTQEQRQSVAAMYATEDKAAREEEAAARFQEEGADVQVWRAYRDGELPDIQISPSSVLLPLEALCLYDVQVARLVLSELAAEMYGGLDSTRAAAPSSAAHGSGGGSGSELLDTVLDTGTANTVAQQLAAGEEAAAAATQRRTLRGRVVDSFAQLCAEMPHCSGVVSFIHNFLLSEAARERERHGRGIGLPSSVEEGRALTAAAAFGHNFLGTRLARLSPRVVLDSAVLSGNVKTGLLLIEQGIVCRSGRLAALEAEGRARQKLEEAAPPAGASAAKRRRTTAAVATPSPGEDSDLFGDVDEEAAAGTASPDYVEGGGEDGGGRDEDATWQDKLSREVGQMEAADEEAYGCLVELYRSLDNVDAARSAVEGRLLEGDALRGVRLCLTGDHDKALALFQAEVARDVPRARLLKDESRRCLASLMRWSDLSAAADEACSLSDPRLFSAQNAEVLAHHVTAKTQLAAKAASLQDATTAAAAAAALPEEVEGLVSFIEDCVESSPERVAQVRSLHHQLQLALVYLLAREPDKARQYVDAGLSGILQQWCRATSNRREVQSLLGALQPLVEMHECLSLLQRGGDGAASALFDSAESLLQTWRTRSRHFHGSAEQWATFSLTRGVLSDMLLGQLRGEADERAEASAAGGRTMLCPQGLFFQRCGLACAAAADMQAQAKHAASRVFLHQYTYAREEGNKRVGAGFAERVLQPYATSGRPGTAPEPLDTSFIFLAVRNSVSRAAGAATAERGRGLYEKAALYLRGEDKKHGLQAAAPVAYHTLLGEAFKGVYETATGQGQADAATHAMMQFKSAVAKASAAGERGEAFEKLGIFADRLLKAAGDAESEGSTLAETAIKSYIGAIVSSSSYEARLRLPRLVEILEANPRCKALFEQKVAAVDTWLLLPWVNQFVSYLGGPAGDVTAGLLRRIAARFPQQVHYALRASSSDLDRLAAADAGGCAQLLESLRAAVRKALVEGSEEGDDDGGGSGGGELLVDEFIRSMEELHNPDLRFKYYLDEFAAVLKEYKTCASATEQQRRVTQRLLAGLWNDMYRDLFDQKLAKRYSEGSLNLKFMQKARGSMQVKAADKTGKAQQKQTLSLYADVERTLKPIVRDVAVLQQRSGGDSAPTGYEVFQTRVREWLGAVKTHWSYSRTVGTVPLATYSDFLATFSGGKSGSLAGAASSAKANLLGGYLLLPQQPFMYLRSVRATELPDVASVSPNTLVLASMQKPKKVVLHCADDSAHPFLVKGGEDLRQDQRIQQLFYMFNSCMASGEGRLRNLKIECYGVIPLSPKVGLVEWVDDSVPMKAMVESRLPRQVPHVQAHPASKKYHEFVASLSATGPTDWVGGFRSLFGEHGRADLTPKYAELQQMVQPGLFKAALYALCATHSAFYESRDRFGLSYAAACVGQWVLGIGDRHLDNFLVSKATCKVIPIDFGHAFGTATELLHIPELMPFRLTPQITCVFEPLSASLLKGGMTSALDSLRNKRSLLVDVLAVFVREPLSTWRRTAIKRGKKGKGAGPVGQTDDGSKQDAGGQCSHKAYADGKLAVVQQKLNLVNPYVPTCVDLSQNTLAQASCLRHKNGLSNALAIVRGRPGSVRSAVPKLCRSTAEQVDCLIDMATDPNILCRTYMGWAPVF